VPIICANRNYWIAIPPVVQNERHDASIQWLARLMVSGGGEKKTWAFFIATLVKVPEIREKSVAFAFSGVGKQCFWTSSSVDPDFTEYLLTLSEFLEKLRTNTSTVYMGWCVNFY
jgi:hypothetical protein